MERPLDLERIPRLPLCQLPTPLQRIERFEAALGPSAPRIFIKRDDLTGLAFGGNKARKLEYLCAGARAAGATHLITEGAAQSNHARMTAAAAAALGFGCILVLDARNGADLGGNLLLDRLFGANVRIVPDAADRAAAMDAAADDIRRSDGVPYVIPTGGSVPLGAVGYARAANEIADQCRAIGESPVRLYTATGSLGTQSGLMVGSRAVGAPWQVRGVAVSLPAERFVPGAADLANATAALLGLPADFGPADANVDGDHVGEAYGKRTAGGLEAIRLMAHSEGILLDPVYSGKALAALIADVRAGEIAPDDGVIFLHTGGGPSLFAHGAALLA